MNLKSIRDHLCLARLALGTGHPLSARLETVERHLMPGDPLFRNDAVSAENDLLAILAELEQLPKIMPPRVVSGASGITERAEAEVPPGVNDAIKQIADAIELL
jgi:hypothetical protein